MDYHKFLVINVKHLTVQTNIRNCSNKQIYEKLYDNDSFSRLRKIIAGCKVLSSALPFTTLDDEWLNDEDLYKNRNTDFYLVLLCAPFALSSIELIIQAMISNFKGT